MSLLSAIRMASNTLQADQIALQVVGQNIANANTPGYIREETELSPAPTQRLGSLLLGLGVRVDAVVQKIDKFLEERLRGAVSEKAGTEAQESTYTQLEQLIGELSDTDISTAMTTFFNSISEVLNQPEDVSTRNLATLNGATLTQDIRRLAERVTNARADLNDRIENMTGDINRLIEQIRVLNLRIAEMEGGSVSKSDAVGLRDQRLQALEDLAKIVDIHVQEQPNGSVTVYLGGEWLVDEGYSHPVKTVLDTDRGMTVASIHIADNDAVLETSGGELHGLLVARDDVLGGFLDKLDDFAGTLAFEFNKIYSSGQGLHGYDELTSESYVTDPNAPLNQAGLSFEPTNGSFKVLVHDTETGLTRTTDVFVNLNGVSPAEQTTLSSLAAALNQIDGLSASIGDDGKLTLRSTSANNQFAFADDTSGLLAALGINTFFTGATAHDIGVAQAVTEDPAKFAASRGGIGADTDNAIALAQFLDKPIDSHNGSSISVVYDRMVEETTQGSTVTKAAAEGARSFEQTLRGQKQAISGVSIDEEAVQMIVLQKSFQASARYISVIADLIDTLVKL
jgi:flagellar hook-associated protein 1 FlgK